MIDFLISLYASTPLNLFLATFILCLNVYIFKNKGLYKVQKILKNITLVITFIHCLQIIFFLFTLDFSKETTFINRSFGAYWWAYWLMFFFNTIFPLFLLNNKLGKNLLFLFLVTFGMNIGRFFEILIITISNFH